MLTNRYATLIELEQNEAARTRTKSYLMGTTIQATTYTCTLFLLAIKEKEQLYQYASIKDAILL